MHKILVIYRDLRRARLKYSLVATKERPVPTILVGLIHIQYNIYSFWWARWGCDRVNFYLFFCLPLGQVVPVHWGPEV